MTNILITGASGFVGKQILKGLESVECEITIVGKLTIKKFSEYKNVKKCIYTSDLFLQSEEWLLKSLEDIDTVIHLAWYAEPKKYLSSEENLKCLAGTLNLAKAVCRSGVSRFTGVGTCAEYDTKFGVLSIDTPLNPKNLYASCKASAYFTLNSLFANHNIGFAWCRMFFLYGDGESKLRLHGYIRDQISKNKPINLTSGNQIRDYMNISDATKEIISITLSDFCGPFNICSGEGKTVREIAQAIACEMGREDLLKFGVNQKSKFDPDMIVGIKNKTF